MEHRIDKRNKLESEPFAFRAVKNGKVFITWNGKQVMTLTDTKARDFLAKIVTLDSADTKSAQLLMAKLTGNFKRGNE